MLQRCAAPYGFPIRMLKRRPPRLTPACFDSSAETAETQDMNEVEKPQVPPQPRTTAVPAPKPKPKPSATKKPVSNTNTSRTPSSNASSGTYFGTNNCILIIWRWGFSFVNTFFCFFSAQNIKCETRLRDKCRGITCNRSDVCEGLASSFNLQHGPDFCVCAGINVQPIARIRKGKCGELFSTMW